MANKYYVVWQGRTTGIFTDWSSCKSQVDQFAGARYKSFTTRSEAEAAFNGKSLSSTTPAPHKSTPSRSTPPKRRTSAQSVKTHTADEVAAMPIDTKIFTDGGCEPNPGEAGSGIAIYRNNVVDELWYGLYNPKGTNNTAELHALHQALIMAKAEIKQERSVTIFCDSKYSIQSITQWAVSWQKNGWVKKTGVIKNLELIKEMFALHQLLKNKIQVAHVNGHVGVEGNELADRMSMLAIQSRSTGFTRYQDTIDMRALLAMRSR